MSNAKQAAFENLQRLSVLLKDIIAVGPELAQIASLEGAVGETQAKLDGLRATVAKERADHERAIIEGLEKHQSTVAQIRNQAALDAANKRDLAQRVFNEARANADALLAKATLDADSHVKDLKASAFDYEARVQSARTAFEDIQRQRLSVSDEIETGRRDRAAADEYARRVEAAKAELIATQQQQSEATAELARLTATIADRQAEHDRVDGMLEDLATKIRQRK